MAARQVLLYRVLKSLQRGQSIYFVKEAVIFHKLYFFIIFTYPGNVMFAHSHFLMDIRQAIRKINWLQALG